MKENRCKSAEALEPIEGQSTDKVWILKDLTTTRNLGEHLIKELPRLDTLLLKGPLGAGKTSLVQGIASALAIDEPITSPTFALSQHYAGGKRHLIHIDLYRLDNQKSANELFLQEEEEANSLNSILVIEWPERLSIELHDAWLIQLSYEKGGGRKAQLISPKLEAKN